MKDSLKNTIKNKFAEERLSDDQLASLIQIQQSYAIKSKKSSPPVFRFATIFSLAAALVLSFSLIINNLKSNKDMPFAIATEVAHNHHKLKPLEVESSALRDVSQYFTKLDFKPVSSALIDPQKYNLLGARYCSLQGITAAQIRYETEEGKLITFYEVPYDENIYATFPRIEKGEQPLVSYANGVGVKMWVEKGLLMAVTF